MKCNDVPINVLNINKMLLKGVNKGIHFTPVLECMKGTPGSKVHGANMGPTWVLSAPDGPHVGPLNSQYVSLLKFYDIRWENVCGMSVRNTSS